MVFLEATHPLGDNKFKVFFGGGDATIGSATIEVTLPGSLRSDEY